MRINEMADLVDNDHKPSFPCKEGTVNGNMEL